MKEVPGRCSVATNSTVDFLGQYAKLGFRVPRWISNFVLFAEVYRRGIPERYPLGWAMRWMGGEGRTQGLFAVGGFEALIILIRTIEYFSIFHNYNYLAVFATRSF